MSKLLQDVKSVRTGNCLFLRPFKRGRNLRKQCRTISRTINDKVNLLFQDERVVENFRLSYIKRQGGEKLCWC